MMASNQTTAFGLGFLLMCAGCATAPDQPQEAPSAEFNVPKQFAGQSGSNTAIATNWVVAFEDTRLNGLIAEVLEKNFNLEAAAANVDAAAASARIAGAALLPAVNLGLQGGGSGNLGSGSNSTSSNIGASLDVSWELDVWGRIRAGRDAATNQLVAATLDYDFARMSLVAQTAKAYFLAIETLQQLQLVEDTLVLQERTLEIVNAFYDEGLRGAQDKSLAQAEVARARDALEQAKAAHLEALRGLEALLGRYPSAEVEIAATLPALPPTPPAGLPSDILERRPDIVAAERRVAAAFNQISEAKAAQLPRISLTGSFGAAGSGLSNITSPSNLIWNAASSLMFPIFDGGRLEAQVEAASAQQRQVLANYQQTALQAFVDVETSLTNETIFRRRAENLTEAYEQAKIAEEIGLEKYQTGEGDLLDVQQLRAGAISAQSALIRVQHDTLVQRVNLHLGLGGSF